ncbi:MAG: hypothetical protein WB116_11745 [Candidatus Dormiibacterota bacterium]
MTSLGRQAFADLDVIGTLDKAGLLTRCVKDGIDHTDDRQVRKFGTLVGRRFSRFPFPDEIVPWLSPLADVIDSKASREASGESFAIKDIVEFRIESVSGWQAPPYNLRLVVIVKGDRIPAETGEDCPAELESWLRNQGERVRQTPGDIANRLFGHLTPLQQPPPTPVEAYYLWDALVEAWAWRCKPKAKYASQPEVMDAVAGREIQGQIVSDREFSLARYRRSEQLDVDYLSPSPPD